MELTVFPDPLWKRTDEDPRAWPRAAVVLEHEWIGGRGRRLRGVGRWVLPCSYEVLVRAGMGEDRPAQTRVIEGASGSDGCSETVGADLIE